MEEVEAPQYFICPISLQIMKDPVTVITGISYDRESIEKWLNSSGNNKNNSTSSYCPVTKQPLQKHSDHLTPNHTLRRLIQAWCAANSSKEIDRIPTKLLQIDLWAGPQSQIKTLKKLHDLACEKESNRRSMAEAGVVKAMVSVIITCLRKDHDSSYCYNLQEALKVLNLTISRVPSKEISSNLFVTAEKSNIFDAITWVLVKKSYSKEIRALAISVLKSVVELLEEASSSHLLERFKPELFEAVICVLRDSISQQATKDALHVLLGSSNWGRNRIKIIEAGAIFHLIELELNNSPEKRTTELIFGVLDQLCSCADGRAKLLGHPAGIAMVSKRILRVSPAVDDRGIRIFTSICKYSGTSEVVQEMLRVGAVSKLCMVLQADCGASMKGKARAVLRLHSNVWSSSPCIDTYLITRYRS